MQHKFVSTIPEHTVPGMLYISLEYCTAAHRCACGCGSEVVTPISPTDWELNFNGKVVSLYPSIGNWNFKCQSHYWIKKGEIQWAGKWSEQEIADGREQDTKRKQKYFEATAISPVQNLELQKEKKVYKTKWWKPVANFLGIH